jgi:hypothetical protein
MRDVFLPDGRQDTGVAARIKANMSASALIDGGPLECKTRSSLTGVRLAAETLKNPHQEKWRRVK